MTLPNFNTLTRDEALAFILSGMQAKRAEIDAAIDNLRGTAAQLYSAQWTRPTTTTVVTGDMHAEAVTTRKRRKLSRAARKAISDAQKRRWAKVRG